MASGTKHFLYNRPEDWQDLGLADGLRAEEAGLVLSGGDRGVYTSLALDTMEPGTVWHRLRLEADIPENGQLELYLYCSNDNEVPPPFAPEGPERPTLDSWLAAVPPGERDRFFSTCAQGPFDDPKDLPLYGFAGRYLWFCLVFHSYSREALAVESIRLEFPRIAFIDYLPQVYRGAESVNSFLARFLSVFQSIYVDLEDHMDQMPTRCDPAVAPPEFLRWLADILAVSDQNLWSEERLRRFLQRAVGFYRIKGTRTALGQVIAFYTGETPLIIEQFEPASCQIWRRDSGTLRRLYGAGRHTVTVLMDGRGRDQDDYAKLYRIIDTFKPVDAICNLVFMSDEIILGQHCYLGMNSRIGGSRSLVLDGGSVSSAPYLAEFVTGGAKTDEQSAV